MTPHEVQSQRIYGVDGVYPAIPANSNGGQNRQAICFQASGDRDNPSISTSEKAYCIPANPMSDRGQAVCFQQNQREEVRLLGEKTGAIAANGGAHQTNYVCAFMGGQGDRARSIAWTEEATPPLKAMPSGSNAVPTICFKERAGDAEGSVGRGVQCLNPWDCQSKRLYDVDGAYRTLDAGNSAGGQAHGVCYALQGNGIDRADTAGCNGAGWRENECYTLTNDKDRMPVCYESSKPPRRYIIRRLTPLECERLQGFPDGWTDVPYKGKPMADSARYRMLGNSIAVPCAEYVFRRIREVEDD